MSTPEMTAFEAALAEHAAAAKRVVDSAGRLFRCIHGDTDTFFVQVRARSVAWSRARFDGVFIRDNEVVASFTLIKSNGEIGEAVRHYTVPLWATHIQKEAPHE